MSWKSYVRTPRGQLNLLLVSLGLAVVLALVIALNRSWFEGHIQEKYADPPVKMVELAQKIERGEAGGEEVQKLTGEERTALYHYWMKKEALEPKNPLPGVLREADPGHYLKLVRKSLVAGSPAQRLRAIAFACRAGGEELAELLRWRLSRAERAGDGRLLEPLREALGGMAQVSSRS